MASLLYDKALQFAVSIVKTYKYLTEQKEEFIMSKQLLRCGTSIGANIAKANGENSTPDFSNHLSIAYKESLNTQYWLSLLKETQHIDQAAYERISQDAVELSKMLCSIVKTS